MAEVVLISIAKSALQLFTSLAKEEFFNLLFQSVGNDLKRLEATIDTISSFLQDTEKRESKDESVQKCLFRLRKAMYDAEDLFDTLAAKLLQKRAMPDSVFIKEVKIFFSKSNQFYQFYDTSQAIKYIRESLDDVASDMERFSFTKQQPLIVVDQQVLRVDRHRTHSFKPQEDVFGRDQDRDRILKMLFSEDESSSVVALIGFGGLGKTTLAQLLYNDERVKQGFDVCLWVCINSLSNLEQVLIEIIASWEKKRSDLSLEKLQQKLREIIGGKRYLVVLDDVWDENARNWSALEGILRCGKTGSKVLVTTRSRKVAGCLDVSEEFSVDVGVLSEDSAWSLFVKKAFREGEFSKHLELEPIGKEIVRKCGYVPLAITVVASVLRRKRKEERLWSDFLENQLMEVILSGDDNSMKQVLMVSYNDLQPNLKLCFAVCSLFPKDYRFDKDELVSLWLTQGYIKSCVEHKSISLEEQGEEYFFELVERSFFQEVQEVQEESMYYGNVSIVRYAKHTAKVHDLLHDVAIDVSKTECMFVDKVSISKVKRDTLRHVSIDREVVESFDDYKHYLDSKMLRTLIFLPIKGRKTSINDLSVSSLDTILTSFKMLRTLHLSNLQICSLSESIGELIHLRYLDLASNTHLKRLPESISKLHRLMILVLTDCIDLEELPPKIESLVSLRQIYIGGCDSLISLPAGLAALTSLVILDRAIVHREHGGLRYLNNLYNLSGVLTIELPGVKWTDAIEDAKSANMSRKHKLEGMGIQWKNNSTISGTYGYDSHGGGCGDSNCGICGDSDSDDEAEEAGSVKEEEDENVDEAKVHEEVLEALKPHERLEYLGIEHYPGDMLSGWVFGMLKNVKELYLYKCGVEYLEEEINSNMCFPSLKILKLEVMNELRGWWRKPLPETTARPRLPSVLEVEITCCERLKGQMPLFEGMETLKLTVVQGNLMKELLMVNSNSTSLPTFGCSNKLKTLRLNGIQGPNFLGERWIRHLTALQSLQIMHRFIGESRLSDHRIKSVSHRGLAHLTALEELDFKWADPYFAIQDDKRKGKDLEMSWKGLQQLKSIKIRAGNRAILQELQHLTSLEYLQIRQLIVQLGGRRGFVFPSTGLHNLATLDIEFDKKSAHLDNAGIQHLHSLRRLRINSCTELVMGWNALFSIKLQELELISVTRVTDNEHREMKQQSHLRRLTIYDHGMKAHLWMVNNIPWESLTSLTELTLADVRGLVSLPDEFQHLASLRELLLPFCGEIKLLPNWIPQLHSLRKLLIYPSSEELERRCEPERGEDWPLIRHLDQVHMSRY